MDNKKRKSLCVKVGDEFYDEVKKVAMDNYVSISNLIRTALRETYGLIEKPKED